MVQLRYADTMRLIAGGPDWVLDLTGVADAITNADDGTVRPFRPQGATSFEQLPLRLANRLQVAAAPKGDTTETLLTHREGFVFEFDPTVNMWGGGAYTLPSGTRTVPTDNLITRPLVFRQGEGAWHVGRRVAPVALTAGSDTLAGLPYATTDRVFVWVAAETARTATLQLSEGANTATEVAVSAAGGVFAMPRDTLTPSNDLTLTAGGLAGIRDDLRVATFCYLSDRNRSSDA